MCCPGMSPEIYKNKHWIVLRVLPFLWFLWYFLVPRGSPWWFSGWKVESSVTLLCASYDCVCVQCQAAVGQRKESTRDFPESCGIIAPPVGPLRLLGADIWENGEKNRINGEFSLPLLENWESLFLLLEPKVNCCSWSYFFVCSGFILTLFFIYYF